MRTIFMVPTLPRHPLLRGLVLVGAAIVLVGLLTVGFVVGIAVVAAAALVLGIRGWLSRRAARRRDPSIIEGEYTVIPPRTPADLPRPE